MQLLPDAGIQTTVRTLRVLRILQLSLADRVSPLQQIDQSLPIRANIRLIGLDRLTAIDGDSDRFDFNEDGRADQLELRILLRYMAGLRGTALTEPELSADAIRIIRLLLGQP